VNADAENDVRRMVGNWHCFDEGQNFDLYGNFDSGFTQSIHIRLR